MRSRSGANIGHSSVRRPFGVLTAGRLVAAAISFIWLAIAARWLTLPEFADLALLLSVGAISSVVADWGFPLVLNEGVAADASSARAALGLVIRRRLSLAALASALTAALYMVAANDPSLAVSAVYAISIGASAWYTSCAAALRGAGTVLPEAVNEAVSRLLVLGIGVAALSAGGGLLPIVAGYAGADVLSAVFMSLAAARILSGDHPVDRSRYRLRRVAPLGLAAVAGIVYYRIDVWLLALMSTADDVAHYTVCYRLLDGLMLPAGALAVVAIRSTANLTHTDALQRTDRFALRLCLGLAPAVLLLEAFPATVLRLAFGESFVDGSAVLRILALAVLPSAAALVWAPLVGLRSRSILMITVVALVANGFLNLAMIPRIGAVGAAIATVIGQVVFAVMIRSTLTKLAATPDL